MGVAEARQAQVSRLHPRGHASIDWLAVLAALAGLAAEAGEPDGRNRERRRSHAACEGYQQWRPLGSGLPWQNSVPLSPFPLLRSAEGAVEEREPLAAPERPGQPVPVPAPVQAQVQAPEQVLVCAHAELSHFLPEARCSLPEQNRNLSSHPLASSRGPKYRTPPVLHLPRRKPLHPSVECSHRALSLC